MSISNWILGVGDRHLSNTLVSLSNGEVISIDFGYSFGTATEFLDIPELVPIRLTPHILNLVKPLDEHGYFQEPMIHSLKALRNNPSTIIAAMGIFLKEPSVDWLDIARQQISEQGSLTWFPQVKLNIAKRKLQGARPQDITMEELKSRSKDTEQVKAKYCEIVAGDINLHKRTKLPTGLVTAEEQIICLIDQATDPNLLGRIFAGWAPWV